ncbi:MAG TPA: DUF6279 family lipoprotein [Usitatibacteraceae bacterium]|nr:DUF6279 family lipoprotein [Usitatibacteraceae bacterium]HQY46155.1 DUF6279 family lipoprotein [Usitatibacteraceae bacterium]HRA22745.1 DUF6279 family lipoprotein [Usitatibacteraceae bacterium]
MRRLLARALIATLVALLAAACSSVTRVAYDNAPFAAAWMVDDWFDLHDGQRDWVKERLARLHGWHRASEMPAYERLLAETAARAARGLSADDARQVHREMRALWLRLVRRAIPDMADFLLQLHPEQVVFLARKFDEDNERTVRESVRGTPQDRLERRQKRYLERIEDWTGRLAPAQRDVVRARVAAMGDLTDEWLGDRRFRQSETIALLRSKPTRAQLEAGLTRLLVDSGSWRRPEYVAKMKARDEQVFAMVADLDATLTAEQRGKLHRRLAGYAADAAYLAVAN